MSKHSVKRSLPFSGKEGSSLLILFLLLCIQPFFVKLLVYDNGLSQYSWYPAENISFDFYVFYKSRIFLFLAAASILWLFLYVKKEITRCPKYWLYAAAYGIFILLSTVFSENPVFSITGFPGHFETVFVLLGYFMICLFSYYTVLTLRTVSKIIVFIRVTACLTIFVGFLQITENGLIQNTFLKKLVMSREEFKHYGANMVSQIKNGKLPLTMDNPNYAGAFVSILLCFLFTWTLFCPKKKGNLTQSILCLFLFFILILTGSRTAVLAFLFAFLVIILSAYRARLITWKKIFIYSSFLLILFAAGDGWNNFSLSKRLLNGIKTVTEPKKQNIKSILTKEQGVEIIYQDETILYSIENKKIQKKGGSVKNFPYTWSADKPNSFVVSIENQDWKFSYDGDSYFYHNIFGKQEKLVPVKKALSWQSEGFASNRGYIWSRTLPFIKNYIWKGSGPDTFPFIFPQNDRVGKFYNCSHTGIIIEKPHNMYLQISIQTGLISLAAFLLFVGTFLFQAVKIYLASGWEIPLLQEKETSELEMRALGAACFTGCLCFLFWGLFNDSAVQISSFFWCFFGMGMGVCQRKSG